MFECMLLQYSNNSIQFKQVRFPSTYSLSPHTGELQAIVTTGSAATGSPSIDNNSSNSPSPTATTALLAPPPPSTDRRLLRPPHDHPLKCPRCDSSHTKFCYYNNYSLSQPRYFCKTCRRYWTKGGSLRNVPVGGGCRKNKRPSSAAKKHDVIRPQFNVQAPVPTDLQLSSLFTGSCDFGGSLGFPMDYSMMPYEAQEDVKPGSRMLSLEWPEQAGYCGDSSYGFGIWAAGMIGGDGPSSAAM